MVRHEHWLVRVFLASVVLVSLVFPVAARSKSTFTTIDVPRATYTEARGINDLGEIVGFYRLADGTTHGFLFTHGTFVTIDVPDAPYTEVHGINNRGEIVGIRAGESGLADGFQVRAFLLSKRHFTIFETQRIGLSASPQAINNRGEIIGDASSIEESYGFLIDAHGVVHRPISVLPDTQLKGINDRGEIVGTTFNPFFPGGGYSFLMDQFGTITVIDVGTPYGINNRGDIVGRYFDRPVIKGFFLDHDGAFVSLAVPGATSTSATGVNNLNEIVGTYTADGTTHSFLFSDRASDDDCHGRDDKGHGHDQHENEHDSDRHCDDH